MGRSAGTAGVQSLTCKVDRLWPNAAFIGRLFLADFCPLARVVSIKSSFCNASFSQSKCRSRVGLLRADSAFNDPGSESNESLRHNFPAGIEWL